MAVFLLLNLVLSPASSSSLAGWRGIVPLHSTRADVERLLGPGTNWCKCGYLLDDVNLTFVYSSGNCKSGGSGGWDVPPDTVLRIIVYPKPQPRLSDLNMDMSKFKKRHDGHIESFVSYVNDEDGLIIEVDEDRDSVNGLYYVPAKKDKIFRCP